MKLYELYTGRQQLVRNTKE